VGGEGLERFDRYGRNGLLLRLLSVMRASQINLLLSFEISAGSFVATFAGRFCASRALSGADDKSFSTGTRKQYAICVLINSVCFWLGYQPPSLPPLLLSTEQRPSKARMSAFGHDENIDEL